MIREIKEEKRMFLKHPLYFFLSSDVNWKLPDLFPYSLFEIFLGDKLRISIFISFVCFF